MLEPITRQEQIIAGKDLKPITRMEKFLKEYGGASSGISIKKAVFTDRPSLWEWLLVNGRKIIQSAATMNGYYETKFGNITPYYSSQDSGGDVTDFEFATFGSGLGLNNKIAITACVIGKTETKLIISCVTLDDTSSYQSIPDEYWSQMGITVTIYYFDE